MTVKNEERGRTDFEQRFHAEFVPNEIRVRTEIALIKRTLVALRRRRVFEEALGDRASMENQPVKELRKFVARRFDFEAQKIQKILIENGVAELIASVLCDVPIDRERVVQRRVDVFEQIRLELGSAKNGPMRRNDVHSETNEKKI